MVSADLEEFRMDWPTMLTAKSRLVQCPAQCYMAGRGIPVPAAGTSIQGIGVEDS